MAMTKNTGNKFFPEVLFEISVMVLFTLEVVLIFAVLFPSSPGREIDFAAQYQPRPEWYFLFLYQLTKYFPGPWTFVGAALLPGLAFSIVMLAPFLDSGRATSLRQRKGAAVTGFGLLACVILLTILSLL
jgi:quinol-cytochrome oxidoreductase complex cytochrome b subunit